MTSKILRTAAVLGALLALAMPASAVTPQNPYVTTVSATQANSTVTFGFDADTVFISNDGANEIFVRWGAVAVASATTNVHIPAYKSKSFPFAPGKGPATVGIICSAGETSTVRVEAYAEGVFREGTSGVTEGGAASTVSGAQTIGSLATTTTLDVGSDLTVAGTATVTGTLTQTGVATFAAAPVMSALTASRLVVTGAGKALASNGAITTNTLPKSASSGATLADSSLSDNGTTVSTTENMTVGGTLGVTGVATLTAQPIVSSLTASRLIVSDGSKGLASNGAITTNALTKSASSGASLAASALADDGTTITATEPILATASIQGNYATKALTSGAAAAAIVVIAVPSGSHAGGKVDYCFEATDNTDFQARCGIIPFAAVNKAGAITCTVGTVSTATEVVAVSTGTLTATWSCADGTGNDLQLKATDTTSLTIGGGFNRLRYRVYGQAAAALTITAQ